MYRILVINWQDITHPQAGGAEVHLHEIFKRLVQRGHAVTVLCSHYPGARKTETIDGIEIVRTGGRNWFNYVVPTQYRKLCRTRTFDVVLDDINKIPFFTPLFVKGPLIAIVHHLFGRSIYQETNFVAASYVYLAEKLVPIIYGKTPVAAVSPSTRDDLIGRGFQREQIELIYNGVDTTAYFLNPKLRSADPVIGYLGRIRRYKSVGHVLAALKAILPQIPDVRLLLVGDGEFLPEIRRQAVVLGITDKIEFTGFVGEAEKVKLLSRMWMCINPSPKEGWGISVIEANACGTPVIAADSPGLRDSVKDGETGLLYPYGDIGKLSQTIVDLVNDEGRRAEMSVAARTWAEKFSWDNSARQMECMIEEVIETHFSKNGGRGF